MHLEHHVYVTRIILKLTENVLLTVKASKRVWVIPQVDSNANVMQDITLQNSILERQDAKLTVPKFLTLNISAQVLTLVYALRICTGQMVNAKLTVTMWGMLVVNLQLTKTNAIVQ